jgi:predicted translin family RNA/ssDNA-binding protein
LTAARDSINKEIASIQTLSKTASQYPYYKYSYSWTREMQGTVFSQLLTLDDVGRVLDVPVNLKDRDAFHLTIEEYLQSLISLLDELARLARNSVTLGDYRRPMEIAKFIKEVHAGFQILNLKNDSLRKRSDGVKYKVKEVEDVVYDLSLRGLLPKE